MADNTLNIAVVGGGIAGCSAAWFLRQALGKRASLTVFESSDRVGGRLATVRVGGVEVEAGGTIIHETNRYMAGITDDNEWKGIRIVTDLDNDLIDMYGRSESDGSWTTMAIGLDRVFPEDGIGSVAFYSLSAYNTTLGYQGTNDVYLDDILVTWVPEPATICLLTVGGLGVLMRRRRR